LSVPEQKETLSHNVLAVIQHDNRLVPCLAAGSVNYIIVFPGNRKAGGADLLRTDVRSQESGESGDCDAADLNNSCCSDRHKD
jgi:hypothetical protein